MAYHNHLTTTLLGLDIVFPLRKYESHPAHISDYEPIVLQEDNNLYRKACWNP